MQCIAETLIHRLTIKIYFFQRFEYMSINANIMQKTKVHIISFTKNMARAVIIRISTTKDSNQTNDPFPP